MRWNFQTVVLVGTIFEPCSFDGEQVAKVLFELGGWLKSTTKHSAAFKVFVGKYIASQSHALSLDSSHQDACLTIDAVKE